MSDYRAIWLVTKGEYADYRVVAAFENEDDAEAARANGLGEYVEIFTLYPRGAAPKKVSLYHASNGDGWHERIDVWSEDIWDVEESFSDRANRMIRYGYGVRSSTGLPKINFVGPDRGEVVAAADALLAEYGMGKR